MNASKLKYRIGNWSLIIVLVLVSRNCTHAQSYRPLVVEGSRWGEHYFFESSAAWVEQVKGDSLVGDVLYKRVIEARSVDDPWGPPCLSLLREDTAERKVFYRNDAGEQLLYDFSLLPGATDTLHSPCDGTVVIRLDSISSAAPENVMTSIPSARFYYLHIVSWPLAPIIWLEGVGSLVALERPVDPYGFDTRLVCHGDSIGNNDYASTPLPPDTCFAMYWLNGIEEYEALTLDVSPNPTSGSCRVDLPIGLAGNSTFMLFNAVGAMMELSFQERTTQMVKFDISGLPAGPYFFVCSDHHGRHFHAFVLKE